MARRTPVTGPGAGDPQPPRLPSDIMRRDGVDPASPVDSPVDKASPDDVGDETVRMEVVGGRRAAREAARPRRARRAVVVVLALALLLAVVAGGGWYLYRSVLTTPDYEGDGTGDVVIPVHDGDTTSQIGAELARRGVVAVQASFTEAAADNDRIRSVQPGYYQMRLRMSGASAVALLLDPKSRWGSWRSAAACSSTTPRRPTAWSPRACSASSGRPPAPRPTAPRSA
jgi:UPF0755 protein